MKKVFINENDLTDYERRSGRASYRHVLDAVLGGFPIIPCDAVAALEGFNEENESILFNYESNTYRDFAGGYYLCNLPADIVERNDKLGNPLFIGYSSALNLNVLFVDNLGTSWTYTDTDIPYTTDSHEYLNQFITDQEAL